MKLQYNLHKYISGDNTIFHLQTFPYSTLFKSVGIGALVGVIQISIFMGLYWIATETSDGRVEAYMSITLMVVALVFAHFLGLVGLIRVQVLRPLLVVLAAIATLWGIWDWIGMLPWWAELLSAGVLYGVTYGYYAWVNRILSFPLVLAISFISLIAARLIIISF